MQLKTVGESLIALNSIQNILNDTSLVGTRQNIALTSSLNAYSVEVVKAAVAQGTFTAEQIKAILTAKGLTEAEIEEVIATNALTASQAGATASTLGLENAFKGLGASMKAFALSNPILTAIAAIGVTIYGAVKAYDALTVSIEEQREKMEESVSAYEEAKSELTDITNEYETQKQELNDLISKDRDLTNEEQKRLEFLQKSTNELRIQKDLAEREEDKTQREAAEDASDLFKKEFGKQDISEKAIDRHKNNINNGFNNENPVSYLFKNQGELSAQIAAYEEMDKLLDKAYSSKDRENIDKYTESVKTLKDEIFATVKELSIQQGNIADYYENIKDTPYDDLSDKDQEIVDNYTSICDAIELVYKRLDPTAWKQMQIDNVFNTEGIEKTKEELIEMSKAGTLDESTLLSYSKLSDALQENKLSASDLLQELNALAQAELEGQGLPDSNTLSFTDAISQVQTLSEGLDQLDKIYADVYDKEDFDWSSILNNEGFQKVFGEFTEEYDDFIKTVSNAPDDINACQDAFDRLATAYLYGSEVLKDLTAETKDATIAMLEQMGITNASEIVTARLAAEEAYLAEKKNNTAIAADNLTEATWNEISAVISEGDASEETRAYLAMLALEKINVNNIRLNTDDDVNAIIAIANAAGASTEYINGLKRALSSLGSINETIETNGQNEGQAGISASVSKSLAEAQKPHVEQQIEDYLEKIKQGIASTKLNPSDYYAHYGGGSATKAAVDKANKSGKDAKEKKEDIKQFEKVIDHIERRIQKFQRLFDKWIKQAETAVTSGFITKYYKKATNAIKKELSTYGKAYSRYMKEANAVGLDEKYAKKVRNGTIDIETIRAEGTEEDVKKYEELADKIQKYQEWYDKAVESTTSFVETAEELYNLPLDKAATKIEKFKDAVDLLNKKLDNAIGSKKKNKLVDKQTKEEKKTLNAQKKAKKETKKILKKEGKNLTKKSTLNNPDVSEKEKKQIKKAVKNGKEVNLSFFKEGSKAYNAAVKYNEALKANKQATYDCAAAQQDYNSWLVEASKIKFDNIADDYDKRVQMLDHQMTALDNRISEIETAGKKVDKSYYESQKAVNAQKMAQYKAEKAALEQSILNIKKGTDEWYEAYDQIVQVSSSISDCVKETYELNNSIN